jgi:hypothetical protein
MSDLSTVDDWKTAGQLDQLGPDESKGASKSVACLGIAVTAIHYTLGSA